jgi:hypothetical protein
MRLHLCTIYRINIGKGCLSSNCFSLLGISLLYIENERSAQHGAIRCLRHAGRTQHQTKGSMDLIWSDLSSGLLFYLIIFFILSTICFLLWKLCASTISMPNICVCALCSNFIFAKRILLCGIFMYTRNAFYPTNQGFILNMLGTS